MIVRAEGSRGTGVKSSRGERKSSQERSPGRSAVGRRVGRREDDGPGPADLFELGVERQSRAAPMDRILGDDQASPAELEPACDLGGGEALRHADRHATGPDDAEQGGHGLDRQGEQQPHRVAGGQALRDQAAGHPVAQPLELAIGDLATVPAFGVLAQGDRLGLGLEATVGDVQRGPREPARMFRPVGQVHHGLIRPVEADAQDADHLRPEAGTVPDRPGAQIGLGREAQLVQEAAEVAPGSDVGRRRPGRGRPPPSVPRPVDLPEEGSRAPRPDDARRGPDGSRTTSGRSRRRTPSPLRPASTGRGPRPPAGLAGPGPRP